MAVLWLLLVFAASYFTCLDTLVHAYPFWALATFPFCFFRTLYFFNSNLTGPFCTHVSSVFKIELTWVQNGPVRFEFKKYSVLKNLLLNNDNFVSKGLQRTNRKIGKTDTIYRQQLSQKRPSIGTFCTHSAIQGLSLQDTVTSLRLSYTYLLTDMSKWN